MTSLVRDVNSCMDYDITGKGKECWIGSHRICVLPLTSALQLNRLIELALSTVANHIVLYPIQLVEIFVLGVGSMAEVTPFSLSFSSKSRNWAAAHFKPACRIGPVFAFVCFLFFDLFVFFFLESKLWWWLLYQTSWLKGTFSMGVECIVIREMETNEHTTLIMIL